MSERRLVRVDQAFFDSLDQQLGSERGPNGEPSVGDFILVDLPPIAEVFATRFEFLAAAFSPTDSVLVADDGWRYESLFHSFVSSDNPNWDRGL